MPKKYWWEEDDEQSAKQTTTQNNTQTQKQPEQTQEKTEKKYWWDDVESKNERQGYWWDRNNLTNDLGNQITTQVNSWLQNHNSFISDYQKRYEGRKYSHEDAYVSDSSDWLNTISQKKSEFDAEADSIFSYIDQNKGYLDQDWIDEIKYAITSARGTQNQLLISSKRDNEYWAKFNPNEEQVAAGYTPEKLYTEWQADRKQHADDLVFDVEAGMVDLEKLKQEKDAYLADQEEKRKQARSEESWLDKIVRWSGNSPDTSLPIVGSGGYSSDTINTSQYDKLIAEKEAQIERAKYAQGYEGYMGNMDAEDYAANSKYVSTRTDVAMEDATWGLYNDRFDTSKLFGDYLYDYINRNPDALGAATVNDTASSAYLLGFDQGFLKTMTDEEIGVYNYLYKTQGSESANEYLSFIESDLEGRRRIQEQAFWAAYAKESPVASSVFSTLISPLKGFSYLGQAADMLDDGKMDENAGYNRFSYIPSSIRSQVSSTIEKSGKWGKVGSFAYNTGMSMADFLFTTAVSGGNQGLSLAIMGSGAAADATLAAKDRGLDDGQAFALGTIAGLAEVAMERISLGAWLEGDMTEGALRYVLKNALSEGGEEAGTSIANLFADIMIAGDKSEWNVAIQKYISEGKSEEEAFALVLAENAAQIGLDALGGILSGAAIGGGTYARSSIAAGFEYGKTGRDKTYTQQLVTEGIDLNPDSKYVQKAKSKVDKGKNLTGMQVRNILTANDMKKIQQAAENRLTTLGQTENVSELAEIATKWATGQEITRAEKKLLTHSQYGSRVANELLPENIASESFSTEWAEGIGTKQVNAAAYNKKAIRELIDSIANAEDPNAYKSLESRMEADTPAKVSDTGKAVIRGTDEEIDLTNPTFKQISEDGVVLEADGKTVNSNEIDYDSEDQGIAINAIGKIEHITPEVASALYAKLDMTKPVMKQLNGIDEAFTYGYYNYSEADLEAGTFTGDLTKDQLNDAFKLGQHIRKTDIDAKADAYKAMRTAAEAKLTAEQKLAKQKARIESDDVEVYFEDGKKVTKFDEHTGKYDKKRMAAVNTAKFLSKLGIGGKYYFFESYVNAAGERVYKDANGNEVEAPNGMYKDVDGSIHIDLNAGDAGQGTALFTMGHELTHFINAQSKRQFKVLCDLVKEAYDKTDMSMHKRVLEKQKFLEDKRGEKVSYDEAYEEVVADAMSTMLTDGSFYDKLMEIKVKDKGLFNTIKRFFKKMIAKFNKVYEELDPDQQDARDIRAMKDMFDKIQTAFVEGLVEASENFQAAMESVVEENAKPVSTNEIVTDGAVVTDGNGERHSIRSMKHDIAEGKMFEDLMNVCGWTQAQVNTLKTQLNALVEYMIPYRNILDMNEAYGMEGRRFSPYKPNSDPLYKISMDFSTLCSKRLLTQYVIEQLQLRENRPMSAEEQMAIRDMLNEYRKVEKGLQVACAMCYVEAARLKSPKQIQRWLDNPAPLLKDYFAKKNKAFNDSVKKAQADFKESKGYDRDAPKKDMKAADVKELNKIGPRMRTQYELTAEEQEIIEKAKTLPNSTYLTAGNLSNLSETDPVIYDAYTAFVRTATRSKSLETDEPYYYGDSTRDNGNGIIVSDSFIEAVNKENGMRFSSWSDWRIHHLLDYITAVIDNSVRGAAMHGYTKFGDEVRVLGKTGMMFNMSGVAGTQTGLNEDGSLNFSDTESIDVNEAIQLREESPETAGLQCIGVSDAHIIALLRSDIIDYIIPYHVSGLNAALRRMADIYGWKDYTGTQHASIDKSIKFENAVDKEHWHEEPVFSEFFVGYDTGMTGIEAMRASAERYKQMCKDRGLKPKFEQFAAEDNYWKLLIDRKMINQQTGNLIQQKAVTPTFDFDVIKGVVDKFVENYDAGLEGRALNHIVENWDTLPQRIKELKKQGSTKANKTTKAVNTLANQTVAAQAKETGVKKSDRYSGLTPSKYNALLTKKPISASKKDWAKVNEARMRQYARMEDSDIPDLDIFRLAEYGKVNEGYLYFVRNYGKDHFAIVGKKQIIPAKRDVIREEQIAHEERNSRKKTRPNDDRNGPRRGTDARDSERSGNGSELREDDAGAGRYEKPVQDSDSRNGTADSRLGMKRSDRNNAPTFYSQMGKVVEGMKQEKFGASSVISMLRGRGVKAEEIRWSGIQAFLDGKKSVTKAELLEFIKGSMLHIEEEQRGSTDNVQKEFVQAWRNFIDQDLDESEILDGLNYVDTSLPSYLEELVENDDLDQHYADYILDLAKKASKHTGEPTKWDEYKLDGGSNYRELVFKMPGSDYSNNAMNAHWGADAKGILAHARMQDFDTADGKMLFVEEIQSDWHNAGQKQGYFSEGDKVTVNNTELRHENGWYNLYHDGKDLHQGVSETFLKQRFTNGITEEEIHDGLVDEYNRAVEHSGKGWKAPDAPFKGNYHEFVLKRLLRMAAEEGYDSIGWTTADIQSQRWSDEYAEGYRIEYDQDIPKFLKKYGKQWDAEVGQSYVNPAPDYTKRILETEADIENYKQELDEMSEEERVGNYAQFLTEGIFDLQNTIERLKGTKIWSMDITPAMKKSVLKEGQAMYSERGTAKLDRAYMDAVNRGDMETAQKMVDEAAKNAGFPVRLLHGTQKFGFTVADTSLSDDKLSFFATSDVDTAKTYSSLGGKRGISEDADYDSVDEESASHEENARDMASSLADKISNWVGYYGYVDGDYIHDKFRDIADDYERGRISQEEADQQMYEFADDLIANGYDKDSYDGLEFWEWQDEHYEEADKLYTEVNKAISAYFALADFNLHADTSGNYDLYANTDGLLVIEGNGAKWDDINSDILPDITSEEYKKYGYRGHWDKWTTRSISRYASDNGYRGVLFKNIYDDGGKSSSGVRKPADVYSFFYPQEQVKSADPVTYDDNGNVIPLSQRFNQKKGDIRYSERGDGTSNRSMLANAFEGITKDSIEYKMIQEYKGHIQVLNMLDKRLSVLNDQIRDIRFTKGKYDAEKLREIEAEADELVKEINRYDKMLLNLEASEPLRKVIVRERKKEAQKTKDHVKEIQQNKKLRAEQTELRHKIRKAVRDLDKILNRGNKKQNVKEDMKGFASKALELADYLFTDHISNDELIRKGITVRMTPKEAALVKETEDILSKLYDHADSLTDEEFTQLDAKRKANEDKLRDLLTAQRNERLNTPVYNLFNDLVTEYANLKNSKQDAVKGAYDPKVEEFLRSYLGETTDGTDSDRKTLLQNMRVADMTTEELWKLHNAYTMVLHSVRQANSLFVKGKTESIEQIAGRIMGDFSKRKATDGKVATVLRNLSNKMGWDYEKLYYALDRIGSEAFTELVMNIANSENIVMQDVKEAAAFQDEMVKKYDFNNWAVNKEIDREFMDNTGKKFKLTLGQLMALYAYSRREGAWDHIEYGGFVFGEAALTNPKPADSYKLSKEQCEAITGLLTKEQKGYAEDMQKFLSETMGEKGNEVSMLLYGIKMFGEKNYFPIHIAGQFKAQANESQAKAAAGFSSMSNAGFTHAQNPNAKAPFVLEGFNEIWVDHVNEMSRYHGTVPALEDMRRVMNRSFYSESGAESMAIKQMMENSYGKEAVEYFDNLYREANSGAITDKLQKKSHKLLSLFRKNSVAYSLSVLIQQPASMVRAYAMIDKKYFGFKGFGAITSGVAKAVSNKWTNAHTNAYNEMLKYAPGVTMAKEIGGFDTHTGGSIRSYLLDTSKKFSQKWKTGTVVEKGKAVLDAVDNNAIANLPNVADKIAWVEIWNACKRETVAKHKDLVPNSEEFMQAVGERFTEVIRATQVYDSMFAKSPMLKSKNLAVQYLVSFMNEPNTTANMVEKAVRDATRGDWKGGAKTAAVVVYSIIFTNLLKSIVYAMRDDDEDETYIEKYIEAVAGNMVDDFNALNYIPLVRDAWSLAQGYDVERADMAIVADALDALNSVIKNATTDTDDMTEEQLVEFDKKVTEANWKLVESLASFFGIPVKNIRREIEGVIDHARIAYANAGKTTAMSAWDKVSDAVIDSIPFMQSKNTKQDKLYDAIVSGDKAYLARLKSTYKTDSAYQSAVRKALRENDPRIQEAAQARYEGKTEEYKRIFRDIQKEGNFSFDDIMSAINTELSKLEPDKVTSEYSATGFVEAVAMGNTSEANAMRDDIIATHMANGKTEAEAEAAFASAVSSGIHSAYSSGLLNEAGAEKMLMEYADKDEEEATSKVSYWAFQDAHPEYMDVFTEASVEKYHEFAEPAGISVDVYAQFLNGTKDLAAIKDEWGDVEVTKREQVLEVIDSLPLTWQQKDALYLAYGYAESQIWDVPW